MAYGWMAGSRVVALAAAAAFLSGCVGLELDNATNTKAGGTAFDKVLYKEYLALAKREYGEHDYNDSDVFAVRAMDAASGAAPAPEEVSARYIAVEHQGEMKAARRELVELLDGNGRTQAPVNAAKAQAAFDCWMQEREENHQPADIAACAKEFKFRLGRLKVAMTPPPPPVTYKIFTVLFDFDSAAINAAGLAVVDEAAEASLDMAATDMTISGYADRAGRDKYNDKLARMRADNVAAALADTVANYLATHATVTSHGEMNNAVETADGVREPANRRVTIEIEQK